MSSTLFSIFFCIFDHIEFFTEFAGIQVCSLNLVQKRAVREKIILFPKTGPSQHAWVPESKYSGKSEAKPKQGSEGKCIYVPGK